MKAGTKSRAAIGVQGYYRAKQEPVVPVSPMYAITFGHNVAERGVLFAVCGQSLVFRPEDAEDIAAKLVEQARLARGGK